MNFSLYNYFSLNLLNFMLYSPYHINNKFSRIYEEAAIGNGVGLNFAAAAELCETQGGHLATFGDYDEELNVYMTWNTYGYWIGLRQEISEDGEVNTHSL